MLVRLALDGTHLADALEGSFSLLPVLLPFAVLVRLALDGTHLWIRLRRLFLASGLVAICSACPDHGLGFRHLDIAVFNVVGGSGGALDFHCVKFLMAS